MEDEVNFTCPDGSIFVGKAEITDSALIIYQKNVSNVSLLFGAVGAIIGNALAEREEVWRIFIDDIISIERKRYRLRKNGCYISLKNGETCVAIFRYPEETIGYLERVVEQQRMEG